MPKAGTKSAALLIAFAVINWSADQLAAGQTVEGIIGLAVGLVLVVGYQFAEELDHATTFDDVVEAIGENTLTALSEEAADVVEDRLETSTDGGSPTLYLDGDRIGGDASHEWNAPDDPRKN